MTLLIALLALLPLLATPAATASKPTTPATRTIRIITWNAKVGRRPKRVRRAVRRMIRVRRPRVICLQEARAYRHELAKINGYTAFWSTGTSSEDGGLVTLVRNVEGVTPQTRTMRMATGWTGPKAGISHDPRVFLEVQLPHWRIPNVHRTRPEWSKNGAAFREEYQALVTSARAAAKAGIPWVAPGDHNIGSRKGRDRDLAYGPWQMKEAIGGRIFTPGAGRIDLAITTGVTRGKVKDLARHGSDHRAVMFTLTAPR